MAVETAAVPARRRAAMLPADERRAAIVEAARPLLLEHGEMVTTKQIAEAAGIAEGTIFRAFPDKDAVIRRGRRGRLRPGAARDRRSPRSTRGLPFERRAPRRRSRSSRRRSLDIWRIASSVGPRFHDRDPPRRAGQRARWSTLFEAHRERLDVEPDRGRPHAPRPHARRRPTRSSSRSRCRRSAIVDLFLHGVAGRR